VDLQVVRGGGAVLDAEHAVRERRRAQVEVVGRVTDLRPHDVDERSVDAVKILVVGDVPVQIAELGFFEVELGVGVAMQYHVLE